jgi:hypothetical protein
METVTKGAYAFLLSAATLHLKWDLVRFWGGFIWWPPWRLPGHLRAIKRAAHRAVTFHNLAVFLTLEMNGFNEERFWREIDEFVRRFPEEESANYRGMFERRLAGDEVWVIKPGG